MNKLQFHENKVLKLTNVLKYKILMDDENFDFYAVLEQMQSYIKTKGAVQIGSLIQYTEIHRYTDTQGRLNSVIWRKVC